MRGQLQSIPEPITTDSWIQIPAQPLTLPFPIVLFPWWVKVVRMMLDCTCHADTCRSL